MPTGFNNEEYAEQVGNRIEAARGELELILAPAKLAIKEAGDLRHLSANLKLNASWIRSMVQFEIELPPKNTRVQEHHAFKRLRDIWAWSYQEYGRAINGQSFSEILHGFSDRECEQLEEVSEKKANAAIETEAQIIIQSVNT